MNNVSEIDYIDFTIRIGICLIMITNRNIKYNIIDYSYDIKNIYYTVVICITTKFNISKEMMGWGHTSVASHEHIENTQLEESMFHLSITLSMCRTDPVQIKASRNMGTARRL